MSANNIGANSVIQDGEMAGKRLLILGGSEPYLKVVTAAKKHGIYTIVVDQRACDRVRAVADECIQYSLLDIEGISNWCLAHPVDGILNFCVDFAQITLLELCRRFDLPCWYSNRQAAIFTNKDIFKKTLLDYGLHVIPSYTESDVLEDRAVYPLLIKPAAGSGSRGSSTCSCKEEAVASIRSAYETTRNGKIIIERFLQNVHELQVTYFMVEGKAHLIRTADSYPGNPAEQMERVVNCSISPSKYTGLYLQTTHKAVVRMLESIGPKNGPCFFQGFFDDAVFRFFDPGLRFPGVNFDIIYAKEYGIDLADAMVQYALSGKLGLAGLPEDMYRLNGKKVAILFPTITAGRISKIDGMDEVRGLPEVFSVSQRHIPGDEIHWSHDVNQRIAEIDIVSDDCEQLKNKIVSVQKTLHVSSEQSDNMLFNVFDPEIIG